MNSEIIILPAETVDARVLTKIAFEAKRHWNYPEDYFYVWETELTIQESDIKKNLVFKAVLNAKTVGFYSLMHVKKDFISGNIKVQKGWWIDHMFVLPKYHSKGIGRKLINHSLQILLENGGKEYFIFVDPFAKGFYEKVGAEFSHNSKSSIKGREIPVYKMKV